MLQSLGPALNPDVVLAFPLVLVLLFLAWLLVLLVMLLACTEQQGQSPVQCLIQIL